MYLGRLTDPSCNITACIANQLNTENYPFGGGGGAEGGVYRLLIANSTIGFRDKRGYKLQSLNPSLNGYATAEMHSTELAALVECSDDYIVL